MPIYEYYCDDCDYNFELLQGMNESRAPGCPKCNKKAKRQISIPGGLVFKGSGFYITDYNKSGGSNHSSITDTIKKDHSADSGKKNESKPESKPDPVTPSTK